MLDPITLISDDASLMSRFKIVITPRFLTNEGAVKNTVIVNDVLSNGVKSARC